MKQHLETKVLDVKALKLSASLSSNKFFIQMSTLHVNEGIKKRLFWILKLDMSLVNPLLLQLYTFDWWNKYIWYDIWNIPMMLAMDTFDALVIELIETITYGKKKHHPRNSTWRKRSIWSKVVSQILIAD